MAQFKPTLTRAKKVLIRMKQCRSRSERDNLGQI
jgi:hypothetical protein